MPRSKEIPEDIRKKVVEAHKSGKGYKLISKAIGLPKTTVRAILRKWKRFGTVETLPRSGRPSKISTRARREIIREVMRNPCTTSKDLQATLASSNICVHHSTIRRILGVHRRPTLSSFEGSTALSSQEEEGVLSASEGSSQNDEERLVLKHSDINAKVSHNRDKDENENFANKTASPDLNCSGSGNLETLTNHNRATSDKSDGTETTPANSIRGGDVDGNKKRGIETVGGDGRRRGDTSNAAGHAMNSAFGHNNWTEEMDYISSLTFT